MYIKLRYRARLTDPAQADILAAEVADICDSNAWEYQVWEEDWSKPNTLGIALEDGEMHAEGHAPLRGISFSPHPECETVWLTFTPDGILNSLFTLSEPTFTADDAAYPWNRVKTGFDGAKTHLAICNLFRFLEKKYFANVEILDETGYWQHGDPGRLEKWMDELNREIKMLDEELAALEADETLDPKKRHKLSFELIRQHAKRYRPDTD
jgi:hypothetical protein